MSCERIMRINIKKVNLTVIYLHENLHENTNNKIRLEEKIMLY